MKNHGEGDGGGEGSNIKVSMLEDVGSILPSFIYLVIFMTVG